MTPTGRAKAITASGMATSSRTAADRQHEASCEIRRHNQDGRDGLG
jgi:hypothetical protein